MVVRGHCAQSATNHSADYWLAAERGLVAVHCAWRCVGQMTVAVRYVRGSTAGDTLSAARANVQCSIRRQLGAQQAKRRKRRKRLGAQHAQHTANVDWKGRREATAHLSRSQMRSRSPCPASSPCPGLPCALPPPPALEPLITTRRTYLVLAVFVHWVFGSSLNCNLLPVALRAMLGQDMMLMLISSLHERLRAAHSSAHFMHTGVPSHCLSRLSPVDLSWKLPHAVSLNYTPRANK